MSKNKIAQGIPTTGKGKGKDQYGRKFGKKHNEAMFEFTKSLWLQDAQQSLKNLLEYDFAQAGLLAFLKTEYGEAQLEFYLEVQKLLKMDPAAQAPAALSLYNMFMSTSGKGIGQQERTKATADLYDNVLSANVNVDAQTALTRLHEEAESTLKLMAFDAFPRFVKSPQCAKVLEQIKSSGGNSGLEGALTNTDASAPKDADDWLNSFVATAESFPACIVISDMTIPGAPMVFVNQEFCRTTGYAREEAVGRNCRFLQGPDTEPEAIQVIRNTLCKGQDCHVKLTNYRKNGELFQNLLSMRPVFDADGIYRFVIGVQFEIKEDSNLKQRLVQLDKLLKLLPTKLNLRSKASSRAKGALAVKVSGEANEAALNKDAVLKESLAAEQQEGNANRPKALASSPMETPMSQMNLENTVYGFTKVIWLNKPMETVSALLGDHVGQELMTDYLKTTSIVYQNHFDFLCKYSEVAHAQGNEQSKLMHKFHKKKQYNSLFYCTSTEIDYGNLDSMNWAPVLQEMTQKSQISIMNFASEVLPKFLNSKFAQALVSRLHEKELKGEKSPLKTAAFGFDKNAESYWLDMFKVVAETLSIGCVISDMTIPGIPLIYVNEGFKAVTGYGKEKMGTSCRFLQGPETEDYLNEEIMAALQHGDPLYVKLHNYKANGQKFQCLFALHPVFGPLGEYKFQIGLQLDFHSNPDITRQLLEMERFLRNVPHSMAGDDANDLGKVMPQDIMGDGTLFPKTPVDPSAVSTASAGGGFGAPAAAGTGKAAEVMSKGKEVQTKKGKGKDQYGRAFGKKQKSAMLEFTKTLWLQDAAGSLRNLLELDVAQQGFMAFLKTEYGESQLEFYLECAKVEKLPVELQPEAALVLYNTFIAAAGKGIGQQERTKSTAALYDQMSMSNVAIDAQTALVKIKEESERTLSLMAFDAFPRFVKSKQGEVVLKVISGGGNTDAAALMQSTGNNAPKDADDWLNMFVSTAESFPACIVISDMTIPGAPMVFVNKEFCNTTGYEREEAVGRNCRFLQGPDTEPEAIQVIRNTLCKGQDCHVKLTNYRKNGEKFQNLLSMRPVFDADGIYRFVIGVQFEIKEDSNLKQRLVQLDKLLKLLPTKLNLRSKASSRAKGALAVKVSGEANTMINNKEAVLQQTKLQEQQEEMMSGNRPKSIVSMSNYDARSLNYDRTIAAFTKIMWLQNPVEALRALLFDGMAREYLQKFADESCGEVVKWNFKFLDAIMQIRLAPPAQQVKKIRDLHMKKYYNPLFYCATTEIEYGSIMTMNWNQAFETLNMWQEQSLYLLASEAFPRFLESVTSLEFFTKLRQREVAGEALPIRTVAAGISPQSDSYWLDMFKVMAESVSIGVVISDMTIPGIPLAYINEGFQGVTGYGKEKIGTSCRFLQGPETEQYLNDEIMAALQQSEPLLVKLHNYKANGQKFQCLFALQPVFGPAPDNEYKFQIGLQLDFNSADPDLPRKIAEMGRVLRHLPQSVGGEMPAGAAGLVASIETSLFPNKAASSGGLGGAAGGLGGMGMSMGGMSPVPPSGMPPSFTSPRVGMF